MNFTFTMHDYEANRHVEITQGEVEYLGDLAEVLLTFIKACGYTYVGSLTLEAEDGSKEWTTL